MYLEKLTMNKFETITERVTTVVIPIGTTEAHGLHCPLGTDFMIPNHLVKLLEAQIGEDVLFAPTVNYGCSWNLGIYPGTINISSETMALYIEEIGNSLFSWGINNIIFLNGHGGNRAALQIAAQHLADSGANVLITNYWLDYMPQILEICSSRGHAGEDETSLILAITPELVEMDLATSNPNKPIGQIFSANISLETLANAMTGDARTATAAKGEAIYALVVENLIKLFNDFCQGIYVE